MAEELLICHQCRTQRPHVIYCTYVEKDNKSCNMRYCARCIVTRYPPEEAERAKLGNWVCPKSRGMCECSLCRKDRWLQPIGNLTNVDQRKYMEMADCARAQLTALQGQESLLPRATIPITKVASIDMTIENVGPALQFLEHCRKFSQAAVYNIKDGEAERILDEIIQGLDGSSGQPSFLEKFHRDLLSIILTNKKTRRSSSSVLSLAGDAWVAAVERLIHSESLFRAVPPGHFQSGSCYRELDANWKLRILNFLCDLALDTKKLKRFLPTPTSIKRRETDPMHWKELPASQKVIALWKKLKDEEAKAAKPPADGMVFTFEEEEEYERRLSQLKEEFRKAYLEIVDALTDHNLGPERSAKRVKPLMSDTSGRIFVQIDGYMESSSIVVQDVVIRDHPSCKYSIDKWYVFPKEDEIVIEEYCSSKRIWEAILKSALERLPSSILQLYDDDEIKDEGSMQDDEIKDNDGILSIIPDSK